MGFSETLKDILDQGLAVSKELAAKAGEKAQDWGAKGMEASRDFASKAGAKIQELGEKGVLMLEIKQLEGQAKKIIALLGAEMYRRFEENHSQGTVTFTTDDPEIRQILDRIVSIKEIMERKETEFKNVGKSAEN